MRRKWIQKEEQILRRYYHQGGWRIAQQKLLEAGFTRPKYGILEKANKLALKDTSRCWSNQELQILKEAYPIGGRLLVHQTLEASGFNRSLSAIKGKATTLQIKSYHNGRFRKGNISANKGKSMTAQQRKKASSSWFQKGHTPTNKLENGAITTRTSKSGRAYQFIRIAPRVWRLYHRHLWQQYHGPIPKGMLVYFKDGNTLNCQLENLAIRSRKDHLQSIIKASGGRPATRLSDGYIKSLLQHRGIAEELITQEMIELKRAELLLKREIKHHGNHS